MLGLWVGLNCCCLTGVSLASWLTGESRPFVGGGVLECTVVGGGVLVCPVVEGGVLVRSVKGGGVLVRSIMEGGALEVGGGVLAIFFCWDLSVPVANFLI